MEALILERMVHLCLHTYNTVDHQLPSYLHNLPLAAAWNGVHKVSSYSFCSAGCSNGIEMIRIIEILSQTFKIAQ